MCISLIEGIIIECITMSRHNYTNPAFCQQSEFYNAQNKVVSPTKVHRSESMHSFQLPATTRQQQQQQQQQQMAANRQAIQANPTQMNAIRMQRIQQRELPPKPGPKPPSVQIKPTQATGVTPKKPQPAKVAEVTSSNSGRYALVPVEDLPSTSQGRYAVLPVNDSQLMRSNSSMLCRSQDDLDRYSSLPPMPSHPDEEENGFTSLPPVPTTSREVETGLTSAFSTDFINKSMILVDQNSMQRYAIVPTDDDEEMVDSNHEIIQMHNGRVHRYAVIPTDEEETCLSADFETSMVSNAPNYATVAANSNVVRQIFSTPPKKSVPVNLTPQKGLTPRQQHQSRIQYPPQFAQAHKMQHQQQPRQHPATPTKNEATQKLHELLTTPRKANQALHRATSYHTIARGSPGQRYASQILSKPTEFTPQKLQYESRTEALQIEQRTTAIISPRLQQSIYNDTISSIATDKSFAHRSFQKVTQATATIGIISLMLTLSGIMNSGLCLYMVTDVCLLFTFSESHHSLAIITHHK